MKYYTSDLLYESPCMVTDHIPIHITLLHTEF